jgi:hypothetical protein
MGDAYNEWKHTVAQGEQKIMMVLWTKSLSIWNIVTSWATYKMGFGLDYSI